MGNTVKKSESHPQYSERTTGMGGVGGIELTNTHQEHAQSKKWASAPLADLPSDLHHMLSITTDVSEGVLCHTDMCLTHKPLNTTLQGPQSKKPEKLVNQKN